MPIDKIASAVEVFARGFAFTRSFTHPYIAERVESLWVLRDGQRRNGRYRREEWVAWKTPPGQVDEIARRHTRGGFAICAIVPVGEDDGQVRQQYKALGYRLNTTEPFMVHDLARIPRFDSPAHVERVDTQETADRLKSASGSRQLLPEHLSADSPLRQYVALIDGQIVGWARSIQVGDAGWCAGMFVQPEYRRRGIARSMLCRMLRDDRAAGCRSAVLLASHIGAKLYPVVGYRQIGTLLLYTPRR